MSDRDDYAASLIASAGVAVVGTDREGIITIWNAAAERLFGYSADDALGRHISMLSLPDDQADEADAIARIQSGDGVILAERVLLTKSQEQVEVSVAMSPIRDAGGTIVGTSRICTDNRNRRRLEAAALHLRAVVASSDDVIISKDLDGIVQSWNPAAERLFGFTAKEMLSLIHI